MLIHACMFVREFIMGHTVKMLDRNKYEKIKYQQAYAEVEYHKALPWLNILSCDSSKIDRSSIDAYLEARKAAEDVMRREIADLQQQLKVFMLESKERWQKIEKISLSVISWKWD